MMGYENVVGRGHQHLLITELQEEIRLLKKRLADTDGVEPRDVYGDISESKHGDIYGDISKSEDKDTQGDMYEGINQNKQEMELSFLILSDKIWNIYEKKNKLQMKIEMLQEKMVKISCVLIKKKNLLFEQMMIVKDENVNEKPSMKREVIYISFLLNVLIHIWC
jgi:hypothetical protein